MRKRLYLIALALLAVVVSCLLVGHSAPNDVNKIDLNPSQAATSTPASAQAKLDSPPTLTPTPEPTLQPSSTPTAVPTLTVPPPTATQVEQASPTPAWSSKVDQLSGVFLSNTHLAGLAVGIHSGSSGDYNQGYGYASVDVSLPVQTDTIFEIGSLTKQFTAAAILQLVEDHRVELDTPVSAYLSGLPEEVQGATIRQLLSHTAGITDPDLSADFNSSQILSKEDLSTLYIDKITSFAQPGQAFQYSNAGYWLLGLVIEAVSGDEYGQYLQNHIFGPLDMEHTSYCRDAVPIGQPSGLAQGYAFNNESLMPVNANMSLVYSAGGLCSTTADMLTWIHALTHGMVISPKLYQEMITPVNLPNGDNTHYGLGLFVRRDPSEDSVDHGGNIGSFQSYMVHYLDQDLDLVVLTNTGSSGLDLGAFAKSLIHQAIEP